MTEHIVILLNPDAPYGAHEAIIVAMNVCETMDGGTVWESAEKLAEFLNKHAAFGFKDALKQLLNDDY